MPSPVQNFGVTSSSAAPARSSVTSQTSQAEGFEQLLQDAGKKETLAAPAKKPASRPRASENSKTRQAKSKDPAGKSERAKEDEKPQKKAATDKPGVKPDSEEQEESASQSGPSDEAKGAKGEKTEKDAGGEARPDQQATEAAKQGQAIAPVDANKDGTKEQKKGEQGGNGADEDDAPEAVEGQKARASAGTKDGSGRRTASAGQDVQNAGKTVENAGGAGDAGSAEEEAAGEAGGTGAAGAGKGQVKQASDAASARPIVSPIGKTDDAPLEAGGAESAGQAKANAGKAEAGRVGQIGEGAGPTDLPDLPPAGADDAADPAIDAAPPSPKITAALPTTGLDAPAGIKSPAEPAIKAPPSPEAPPAPEIQFAQNNHDRIVTAVQGQLLPRGGTMQLRLDPPELGALHVMVEMRDGVMNATFQTTSDQATQLLGHSLGQLKQALETQGVSVERLQVQQAPPSPKSGHSSDSGRDPQQHPQWSEEHAARQERERKELMRRMWRKVSGFDEPIDYLA